MPQNGSCHPVTELASWVWDLSSWTIFFCLKLFGVNSGITEHSWLENGPGLKMYFLLKMGMFHCYVSLPEIRPGVTKPPQMVDGKRCGFPWISSDMLVTSLCVSHDVIAEDLLIS